MSDLICPAFLGLTEIYVVVAFLVSSCCALAPWSVNFQTHPAAHPTRNIHRWSKEDYTHFDLMRRITSTHIHTGPGVFKPYSLFNLPSPSESGEDSTTAPIGKKRIGRLCVGYWLLLVLFLFTVHVRQISRIVCALVSNDDGVLIVWRREAFFPMRLRISFYRYICI